MDSPDPALVADIVTANLILFDQGVVDGFGHVSARHDKRADRFLLARNMAPGLVAADDIVTFDLDGAAQDAAGRRVYLERFIHSEIYRARPDVMAVVHSHSPSVVPFGVAAAPLRAICHMSGFVGDAAPVFEIRETAGDATSLLITSQALGAALAQKLGGGSVVLMRGHGSTVAAGSVRQAVFRAVYTEVNARLQADAMRLGAVTYLSGGEQAAAVAEVETQIARAWDLWRLRAEAAR